MTRFSLKEILNTEDIQLWEVLVKKTWPHKYCLGFQKVISKEDVDIQTPNMIGKH